ncbi:MAG: TraU family protein [Sulfolobaceae archaeon]
MIKKIGVAIALIIALTTVCNKTYADTLTSGSVSSTSINTNANDSNITNTALSNSSVTANPTSILSNSTITEIAKDLVSAMTLAEGMKYQSWANAGDVDWKIIGVCIKYEHGHPVIAPRISMWLPLLIIETPNKFAYSKIGIVKQVLQAIGAITNKANITSGSITADSSHPMQFREAHIIGFPLKAFEIMHPKPKYCNAPTTDMFPYYISELDMLNWRQTADQSTVTRYLASFFQSLNLCGLANLPSNIINSLGGNVGGVSLGNMCIGNWATLYPRVGFVDQQSEVVGSAVDAVRSVSWDSYANNQPRIDIAPIPISVSTFSDKIQMAKPSKQNAMYIGTNFKEWDNNLVSKDGYYAWIYWKKFTCCMW